MVKHTKPDLIGVLARIKAIKVNTKRLFTWSSGIKSPIYIDNRILGSFVVARQQVYTALANLVKTHFPHTQAILGVATGGIIPASFVAQRLRLPVGYVRGISKAHGRNQGVEGFFPAHTRVVLVEDTVTTGQTLACAYEQVRQAQLTVLGGVCVFNYNLLRCHALVHQKLMIELRSLLTADDLMAFLARQPLVQQQIKTFLRQLNP